LKFAYLEGMNSPETVTCSLCVSHPVRVKNITDTHLDFSCEACGARFQIEYPRKPKHDKDASP
jgi:hypothetical protein